MVTKSAPDPAGDAADGGDAATGAAAADVDKAAEQALPLGPQPLPELIEYRRIEDAETIKALADPLRLRIMRALGREARRNPRIMTVKQLAEELGEPTTKLYRHMNKLLAADLIQVAELRLVGGIVEQQYRVAQVTWGVHTGGHVSASETGLPDEVFGIAGAATAEFFRRYEAALRGGHTRLSNEDNLKNPPYVRSVGAITDARIPRERAAEFGERLHALVHEFNAYTESPDEHRDAVSVNLMAIDYATETEA
jgi:DNA-binding transcriptional ArsR family regulator